VIAAALLLAPVIAGCQMLATIPLYEPHGESCKSAAGAYFLPKRHVIFKITQGGEGGAPFSFVLNGTAPVADRDRVFCLDYLGSPLADDTIHVTREDGLLRLVSSVADDKSKQIAEAIIQAGVIGVTGNPNFGFRSAKIKSGSDFILAEYKFDPFDRERLAEINATMAPTYGYCVVVEGHTVHPDSVEAYCANPRGGSRRSSGSQPVYKAPPGAIELPPLAADAGVTGILYRPNLTHQIVVMRRSVENGRKSWRLFQTAQMEFPNIAPVFSIGVERSLFVKRTTRLDFDFGVLRDITIEKPSELVEFMEIPLVLAQAIVKVPAEVIKVRLASTKNETLLIDAQRELLATQREYNNTLKSMREKAAEKAGVTRSGAFSLARAFDQLGPDRRKEIDDACKIVCPTCELQACRATAISKCQGQDVQTCLPGVVQP
jgi:hypothetical protein